VHFSTKASKRKKCKNFSVNLLLIKQQHRYALHSGLACLNARLLAGSRYVSGRSCDRQTGSRFAVVFLGSRANAELVPKFHVELRAFHAVLRILTSKLRPKVAPQINIQFPPNAAPPKLITKFKIMRECNKTQHNFSPRSTLHLTFSYPYQKDERALHGDLRSPN
jgi:hypothetical protein